MARTSEFLTAADVDAFALRLKATVAAAQESAKLKTLLESFSASLRGGRSTSAAAPRAAAAPSGRRTRQPGLSPAKVLAVLTGVKDGLSVSEIATKVGEKKKPRVAAALRQLRDEKKARLKGEKRLARWYAA